jgi:hypothetical protein
MDSQIKITTKEIVAGKDDVDVIATVASPNATGNVSIPNIIGTVEPASLNVSMEGRKAIPGGGDPSLYKYLSDVINVEDILVDLLLIAGRDTFDAFSLADEIFLGIGKAPVDTAYSVDTLRFEMERFNSDDAASGDIFSISLSKYTEDTAESSDGVMFNIGVGRLDNATSVDTLLPFSVGKVLLDIITTTDDLLGEANIDDDQYASIGKTLVDTGYTADTFAVAVSISLADFINVIDDFDASLLDSLFRSPKDTSTTVDLISLGALKQLIESIAPTDFAVFDTFKELADTASTTDDFLGETNADDDQYASINKTLAELQTATEIFQHVATFVRSCSDNTLAIDNLLVASSKMLMEVASITENVEISSMKNTADLIASLEAFAASLSKVSSEVINLSYTLSVDAGKIFEDTASVTQEMRISFGTQFTESLDTSDIFSLNAEKFLQDTQITAETGVVYNQGYFDEDYAELGYSGTITNF